MEKLRKTCDEVGKTIGFMSFFIELERRSQPGKMLESKRPNWPEELRSCLYNQRFFANMAIQVGLDCSQHVDCRAGLFTRPQAAVNYTLGGSCGELR